MKKKVCIVIVLLLLGILGLVLTFVFNKEDDEKYVKELNNSDFSKLVVSYSGRYADTEDLKMVEEEINKIVREQLGVEVELKVISQNFKDKVNLMLAGKEQVDVLCVTNKIYMELYIDGQLSELGTLLEEYGQGIIDAVGIDNINACKIDGKLYGLANNRDYAAGWDSYMLRKDILVKYGLKKEDIKSIKDLEKIYDMLLEKEPDIIPVSPDGTMLSNCELTDGINSFPAGGHLNYGQNENIVNIFETEEYMERLKQARRWYLKGYMGENILNNTKNIIERVQSGKLFSYIVRGKPGIEVQESIDCGREMVIVQFGKNAISYNSMAAFPWVISKNTISEEKSMQLLNLMYTNEDIMNLLSYGIEGVHYVKTDDGHITFPDGVTTNIFTSTAWKMPNQYITYVWEGNPLNLWDEMDQHNKSAIQSCEIGFNFDVSSVSAQYLELESIYNQYKVILENGLVDPEEGLDEMLRELKSKGLDDVIKEKQRQFNKWRSQNKK